DEIPVDRISAFEDGFLNYLDTNAKDVLDGLREEKALTDTLKEKLTKAVGDFVKIFSA
ncbi:MAG: ATP synthase subunit alpha, partial [Parcubacteria group bacterium GW2011_GWA2_56_7]